MAATSRYTLDSVSKPETVRERGAITRAEFCKLSLCFKVGGETTTMARPRSKRLVVCVNRKGYSVSLETQKIYVALGDRLAEEHGLIRIIDESGDDYLYPKTFFRATDRRTG
jgi:hypothetical protein